MSKYIINRHTIKGEPAKDHLSDSFATIQETRITIPKPSTIQTTWTIVTVATIFNTDNVIGYIVGGLDEFPLLTQHVYIYSHSTPMHT